MKSNGVRPIAFLTLLVLLGTTIAGGAFLMCSRVSTRTSKAWFSLIAAHEIENCATSILESSPPAGSISIADVEQHTLCVKPASFDC